MITEAQFEILTCILNEEASRMSIDDSDDANPDHPTPFWRGYDVGEKDGYIYLARHLKEVLGL